MGFGAGGARDPFNFTQLNGANAFVSTVGKTVADPRPAAGDRVLTIIAAGQSLISNSVDTNYTPTSITKINNINFVDGSTWQAKDPLLGCSTPNGNYLGRMADKLIAGGVCDAVNLVPIGVSGTSITQWIAGGLMQYHLLVAAERCAALGLSPIFLWDQGQSDAGMAQATYQANLQAVIAQPRSRGFNGKWFVAKSTMAVNVTDANIRAAQAAVVNGTNIHAGPDEDTLTGGTNRYDGTHFTAVGADAVANLWKTAIDLIL